MPFRFYTNTLSHASRTIAGSILMIGLLLIGFGMLIMALPELFAFLAAAVFFLAGVACTVIAVKIFWAQRRLHKRSSDEVDVYRENVRVHRGEHHDF